MRTLYGALVASVALVLSGCLSDGHDPDGPSRSDQSTGVPAGPDTGAPEFRATWDPLSGLVPYPNDILGFLANPPTDGTLNLTDIPFQLAASSDFGAPLNQMDGFSTFSRLQTNFSGSIAEGSLNPLSVFLLEVALDPATRAVIGLSDETLCKLGLAPQPACPPEIFGTGNPFLVQGVDYTVEPAPDTGTDGATLQLTPLKPLNPLTVQQFTEGAFNGYLMILSNGITDVEGTPAAADTQYEQIKQAFLGGAIVLPPPGAELPPLSPEELIGIYTAAQLAVVQALADAGAPVAVEDVVVTASFSPQDTATVMESAAALEVLSNRPSQIAQALAPVDIPLPGGGTLPAGTPLTTGLIRTAAGFPPEASRDNGDIYLGGLSIPYFQEVPTDDSGGYNILTSNWVAAAGQNILGDPDSTVISRWNPVPVQRGDVTIPVYITVPNANSAWVQAAGAQGAPVPPPTGWPVVIYQPGFTRDRTDQPLVAEGFLDAGYAVVTIDLPLHGVTVTDPAEDLKALFRVPGTTERTFDLDLRNNDNPGDLTPDGKIDSSSLNFISPAPDGLLATRDNIREAIVGLLALRRSVGVMDIDGDAGTTDFDGSQVHYVGHSGGAIAGGILFGVSDEFVTASLPNPAAGLVGLLQESDVEEGFGFILAGLDEVLAARGFPPGSPVYNNYLRDMQNIWGEADPINYGRAAGAGPTPILSMITNNDLATPPASGLRFVDAIGLDQVTTPGPNLTSRGFTRLLEGEHGGFIDPTTTPGGVATIEMQTEAVVFVAGNPLAGLPPNGQVILISNPEIVETD